MNRRAPYRFLASSVEGFIQQLAVGYVCRGFVFFAMGRIPAGKDPSKVDAKLLRSYGVDVSRWERARRKRAGYANVHYLRFDRTFVLVASHGRHPFFEREAVKDCRRTPIRVFGYSVSFRNRHASVRIDQRQFAILKSFFLDVACAWSPERIERELRGLPFLAYSPVRRQLVILWRAISRKRIAAGLEPVSKLALRFERRQVRVFAAPD